MSKTTNKYILPPLTVPRPGRQYPKFRKFDVPGEAENLNEAMIAEETKLEPRRHHFDRDSVMLEALKNQQKIGDERLQDIKELKLINLELERQLRDAEEDNLKLRLQLELREEKESAMRNTYDRVVDRLLEAIVRSKGGSNVHSEEQIKRLSAELLSRTLDSDGKISATPPSEPR